MLECKEIFWLCVKRGSSESVVCSTSDGPLMGDCIYDSMTITTPGIPIYKFFKYLQTNILGSPAPPIICGYNTG